MYALKNKVQLIGNIGNKPEIKHNSKGLKLARILLAINETYKNAKGEKIKDTQWHTLVASGRLAEFAEKWLDKGTEIAIEGRLVNRAYTDKEGSKRFVTEIQVNEILILGNRDESLVEEEPALYVSSKWQASIPIYPIYSMKCLTGAAFG